MDSSHIPLQDHQRSMAPKMPHRSYNFRAVLGAIAYDSTKQGGLTATILQSTNGLAPSSFKGEQIMKRFIFNPITISWILSAAITSFLWCATQ